MSVIAWDGQVLAADSQATSADARSLAVKLHRLPDGRIAGFTGPLDLGMQLVHWLRDGARLDAWPATQGTDDWCRLIVWDPAVGLGHYERYPVLIPVLDPYTAFGSGRDFALGAMAQGASAVEAVEAAIKHGTTCGGPVRWHRTER